MSSREIWTLVHGLVFGGGFLLLFSAGFHALMNLRAERLSQTGLRIQLRTIGAVAWIMAATAWVTVILGTYWVYPWYRAVPPKTVSSLQDYPKYFLTQSPHPGWHNFGMEWKEHIAWLVPILLTASAFLVSRFGRLLAADARLRRMVLFLFSVAFFGAVVAGTLGALINKAAPLR
jgi:hypothetical protein